MLTTLLPSCAVVMKSGNLNFLEHSGQLQACNDFFDRTMALGSTVSGRGEYREHFLGVGAAGAWG